MSVQLIVYPQNYEGLTNSTNIPNAVLVDGINFNTVNASTSFFVGQPNGSQEAINFYNPTLPVNTWKRYKVGSSGTSESGGTLTISVLPSTNQQGILQKLSNLTVGAVYNVEIDCTLLINGNDFNLSIFSGTVFQSSQPFPSSVLSSTIISFQFTANSTEDTIVIGANTSINGIINISNISITTAPTQPSGVIQILGDGQVILDLYEDEDLPLTLSVDDFKNVAEKVQSYSKAFNLPATKRNNKIFDHIFEITRELEVNSLLFNPYIRTKAILKQDGFVLFEGYLRMLDITDKEGEISYNVNLYSEVVALADVLGDRTFSDIDFLELSHAYNKTNIKNSWNNAGTGINYTFPNTSGFRDDYTTLKYPFVDYNHQFTLSGTNINYSSITDIFRPFINIKYLIDRIFEATDFTYESEFFDTDDFKNLYMDFNWGADDIPISSNPVGIYASGSNPPGVAGTSFTPLEISDIQSSIFPAAPPDYSFTTHILTNTLLNAQYSIGYTFEVKNTDTVNRTVELQWLAAGVTFDYSGSITLIPNQTYTFTGGIQIPPLAIGETVQPQFKASAAGVIQQVGNDLLWGLTVTNFLNMLNSLRGETGQWDFLKGLITMFNLVTLPDEDNPNNIKIETYADVFIPTPTAGETLANRGIEHNWTDKIDVSQMKLMPLTDLNKKTIFKFVEDEDDYAFNVYKRGINHLYGSKKYDASEFTILAGIDEIIAEPFAATVIKPLDTLFPDFITPSLYSMTEDGTSEGFENSPRIMYNNGVKTIAGYTYNAPLPSGSTGISETEFLQFSHLTDIPTIQATTTVAGSRDFHFGECQLLQPVGSPVNDNLFNLYWLPYYSELYNPNTRIMTIKVNLSPADINTFKFNDTVFIKNRVFRVNKIDYKPNDLATVEFILIP